MDWFPLTIVALTIGLFLYAYFGYPALLWLFSRRGRSTVASPVTDEWPTVSISLPVYNEAAQIRDVIQSLLNIDYPRERLQILIVSDASSDGTDDIVREYASRGVELLRIPTRGGKTNAENSAAAILRGEIVVNTDASIRILPDALKPLIAQFSDPQVGVASGRDISVAAGQNANPNAAESGYVGYEMTIRSMETRCGGIVGASGCFYAIRTHLHRVFLPAHLSRDFASALIAREYGYRAVSVDEALCLVPRTSSLRSEYRRKVRTITRGMETLFHKRHLLTPFRYGRFAWMLFSHKVCRWAVPCGGVLSVVAITGLAISETWARAALGAFVLMSTLAFLGYRWPFARPMPRLVGMVASLAGANLATAHSVVKALQQDDNAAWEPTRRENLVGTTQSHA